MLAWGNDDFEKADLEQTQRLSQSQANMMNNQLPQQQTIQPEQINNSNINQSQDLGASNNLGLNQNNTYQQYSPQASSQAPQPNQEYKTLWQRIKEPLTEKKPEETTTAKRGFRDLFKLRNLSKVEPNIAPAFGEQNDNKSSWKEKRAQKARLKQMKQETKLLEKQQKLKQGGQGATVNLYEQMMSGREKSFFSRFKRGKQSSTPFLTKF